MPGRKSPERIVLAMYLIVAGWGHMATLRAKGTQVILCPAVYDRLSQRFAKATFLTILLRTLLYSKTTLLLTSIIVSGNTPLLSSFAALLLCWALSLLLRHCSFLCRARLAIAVLFLRSTGFPSNVLSRENYFNSLRNVLKRPSLVFTSTFKSLWVMLSKSTTGHLWGLTLAHPATYFHQSLLGNLKCHVFFEWIRCFDS